MIQSNYDYSTTLHRKTTWFQSVFMRLHARKKLSYRILLNLCSVNIGHSLNVLVFDLRKDNYSIKLIAKKQRSWVRI